MPRKPPRRGPKEWTPRPRLKRSDWTEELLQEVFERPPFVSYGDKWYFSYEYPGFFGYYHVDWPIGVYFTPDFHEEGVVGVQVSHIEDGTELEISELFPFSEDRTPEALFDIVKPFLDKYRDWTP